MTISQDKKKILSDGHVERGSKGFYVRLVSMINKKYNKKWERKKGISERMLSRMVSDV